ncbi:MAG: hypothetical protein Q7R97_03160 [Candidatus Daviesbacteria bacterium]|nr:hypothetical protein [Candidatus Daviesbacteria bacterium]
MEITEARKTLGKEAEGMTDDQVKDILTQMDLLANFALDFMEEQIKKNKQKGETANDCLKRLNIMWKKEYKK